MKFSYSSGGQSFLPNARSFAKGGLLKLLKSHRNPRTQSMQETSSVPSIKTVGGQLGDFMARESVQRAASAKEEYDPKTGRNVIGTEGDLRRDWGPAGFQSDLEQDNAYRAALDNRNMSLSTDLMNEMRERGSLMGRSGTAFFKTPEDAAEYYVDENKRVLEGTDFYKDATGSGPKDVYIDEQGMPQAFDVKDGGRDGFGGMGKELSQQLTMQAHEGNEFVERSPDAYDLDVAQRRLIKDETGRFANADMARDLSLSRKPGGQTYSGIGKGDVSKEEEAEVRRLFNEGLNREAQALYNTMAGSRGAWNSDQYVDKGVGKYQAIGEGTSGARGSQFAGGRAPLKGVKLMKRGGYLR